MSYEDSARAAAQGAIDQAVDDTETLMRHCGGMPPSPRVYMFNNAPYPDQGFVICRPSRGGGDTGEAIRDLGLLPAVLRCDRVVIIWEHRCIATLLGKVGNLRSGIVAVNASSTSQEITWQPFDLHQGALGAHGTSQVTPLWSKRETLHTKLPIPVADAIRLWRHGSSWPIATTAHQLERHGYTVTPGSDRRER